MHIRIHDLPSSRALDERAMRTVRGGGAPWVFGWIAPYMPASLRAAPAMNLFQITNNYYANQMNNQIQTVDIRNLAANSNITVSLDQLGNNFSH